MPDFGAPIAENVKTDPNQFVQTLSGLMGVARQGQALQLGQQQLRVGQSQVQQQQEQMHERMLLQNVMATGKTPEGLSLRDSNGEIDPVAMAKFANTDLPLLGQSINQSIIQTQHNRIQLNQATRNLGQNFRDDISGILRSAIGTQESGSQVNAALSAYAKQNPEAAGAIDRAQALLQGISPQMPQAQRDLALSHMAMEFQPAAATAGQQQIKNEPFTGPGGTQEYYQSNPFAPGGMGVAGPAAQQGYAPGVGVTRDQAGNIIAYPTEEPGKTILVGHGGTLQTGASANQQAGQYGTPATILNGLLRTEDGGPKGDPYAVNAKTGAMGPYQFLPSTVAMLAKQGMHFDPFNPQQARNAADFYMAQLLRENGGNYQKAIAQYGGFKNVNPDQYVASVEGQGAGAYQPPVLTMGQGQIIHQNTQTVNQNRLQAANAQTELNVLDHVVSLAQTPGLYLGPGSADIGKLATAVAAIPGMSGAQKYADNYNELAKFMAQNAVRMGKQLGLSGSDARVDLALTANPNAHIGPQTIIGIAQYQQALVRMGVAKADAMDHWLSQPGNSLENEQNFERLWRDNADPRLFELHGMPDQAAAQAYAKRHITGGEQKELAKKWQVLHDLGAF